MKPDGDLLDVVGHEDRGRGVVVEGDLARGGGRGPPARRGRGPAAGSSSSSSSGSVMSARATCTRLRSPSLTACRTSGRARCPTPSWSSSCCGAAVVAALVALAPAPRHGVRRRHDDVGHALVGGIRSASVGAREPDARTQLEDVGAPEQLVEHLDACRAWDGSAWPRAREAWSCRRRWGRAPTQRSPSATSQLTPDDDRGAAAHDVDVEEPQDVAHVPNTSGPTSVALGLRGGS